MEVGSGESGEAYLKQLISEMHDLGNDQFPFFPEKAQAEFRLGVAEGFRTPRLAWGWLA